MSQSVFIFAEEIAKQLNISKPFAYKIIKNLNHELESNGFITIAGRVSRKFFEERVYGISKTLEGEQHGIDRK